MHRRENRLHQVPGNVPPRKRFCSFRSPQTTQLFYGILLGTLFMFGGVELADRSNDYAPPMMSPVQHPMAKKGKIVTGTCTTAECKHLASQLLPKINSSVDPCDDFYSYACGGFIKDTEIPDGKDVVNTFSEVNDLLQNQLLSAIGEEVHASDSLPFRAVKNLYKLCMNKTRIEEQGTKPLLDNLDALGGWPVLTGNNRTKTEASRSWSRSMKTSRALGYSVDYFFDVSVGVDWKNTFRRIIYMDQATLGISRKDLVEGVDNPNVKAYFKSMIDMAVSLGAREGRARQELQDSLNFEIALAKITLPNEQRRNFTAQYNPMSVQELQGKYAQTNWVIFLNSMIRHQHMNIDENEIIIVRTPSFMDRLFPLLQQTPKRTLANYVMWRVIKFSSPFLPEKLQGQQLQSRPALSADQEQKHRSKECMDITSKRLPIAVAALYTKNYFDDESRGHALGMVNDIKMAFVDILNTVDWMDSSTRKTALEKMNSMVFHIGYPEELMDGNKLAEYYKDLESVEQENSYLSTVLFIDRFLKTKNFEQLRQAVSKTDWTTHSNPAGVYAHYSMTENSIQIPAHYFQDPLYSFRWPNYMNYGAIGSVIGRSITHGFDDQGRRFDKIGSPAGWCRTDTGIAFLEKAFCIMKQYMTLKFSGYNTVAEKMADTGGIEVAYHAYKKWAEKNGPDPGLAGLNLKPEQLFWLSAAQTWCSVYRPEVMRMRMSAGSISPDQFRVFESMSNMADFSRDFNCAAGSPMNPVEKCKVWYSR